MKILNPIIIPLTAVFALLIASTVSADDRLKPILDTIYNAIKTLIDKLGGIISSLFPSLDKSIEGMLNLIYKFLPFMKDFNWIFYILLFVVILIILTELWDMSKYYIMNTISGVILLLILIHVLGVGIRVTLPAFILIILFGIPGVLLILILHYLGIFL